MSKSTLPHAALMGDSIFDNRAYVKLGEPDVREQLIAALPDDSQVTLLAVDGSTINTMDRQIGIIPERATHLIVSVGGNDALGQMNMLNEPATSSAEVLTKMYRVATRFEGLYQNLLQKLLMQKLPTILCTIYYPHFPEPAIQQLAKTGLTIFNDAIIRQAFMAGLPLIDLRLICNEETDYANSIEPSAQGGEKIARVIARAIRTHDFSLKHTTVYL